MYYLQSRYYNPQIGRFINADAFVSTSQALLGNNMFAYCENDPCNLVDPMGDSPYSGLSVNDYYWIHRYVQEDISRKTGWATEVYVSGSKGIGRLDLYDVNTNRYYEVKSRGAAYTKSTRTQIAKYDQSKPNFVVSLIYRHRGKVTRNTQKISGSFSYGIYDVTYRNEAPGLIVYDVTLNFKRATKYLSLVAAFLLAVATGGASLPFDMSGFAS